MILAASLLASADSDESFAKLDVPLWAWAALVGLITVLLLVDLLLVHRKPHVVGAREAAIESAAWISVGLGFWAVVHMAFGAQAGGEYVTAYLVEKSLSVDNVFVWALIFSYFAVPRAYQHRVLFWGIFGALVLRLGFILAGVALIERFEWILIVFGAFLVFTAVRLVTHDSEAEVHPEHNPALKVVRKVVPSTTSYDGHRLFTRENGRRLATPLLAVLVMIETTDVVFAVDSVPAVLGVSREAFIAFASNAFAILGLRALYFLLADMHARFSYLQQGLAVILAFVGLRMIVDRWYHVPTGFALLFILLVLVVSVLASLRTRRLGAPDEIPLTDAELPPPPQER